MTYPRVNTPKGGSGKQDSSSRMVLAMLFCCLSPAVYAQNWRAALEAEKAQNAQQISAIESQGAPIAAELRQLNKDIDRHNGNRCEYPQGHPEACAGYSREATELSAKQQNLRSQLQQLVDRLDRLQARNREIDLRLRCVTLPKACKSDADCNECSYCASFDGDGNNQYCHPKP